jgi:hypothetical protein
MKVGMRVDTQYGQGTVKGFERFAPFKGTSMPLATEFGRDERIAVELDPGHTWPAPKDMLCYFYERDIRPALRPLAEVIARGPQCMDHRDFNRLAEFMTDAQLLEAGYEITGNSPDRVIAPWTREAVMEQFRKDVDFGFEKAIDQRGISAAMMAQVVGMWFYAFQDDKGLEVLKNQYTQYGLPVFKYAALTYGFPNEIGDDVGNESKYAG